MLDRQQLIDEANELGLEFPKNIKTFRLATMVAEATGSPLPIDETPEPGPAVKPDAGDEEEAIAAETATKAVSDKRTEAQRRRALINETRQKAMETKVVVLTNKDPRENEFMTTAYLSFENQHFSMSRVVPLDVPVELEQALIHIAETILIPIHRDEIKNGQRTGNKIVMQAKKYVVSYPNIQKQA